MKTLEEMIEITKGIIKMQSDINELKETIFDLKEKNRSMQNTVYKQDLSISAYKAAHTKYRREIENLKAEIENLEKHIFRAISDRDPAKGMKCLVEIRKRISDSATISGVQ